MHGEKMLVGQVMGELLTPSNRLLKTPLCSPTFAPVSVVIFNELLRHSTHQTSTAATTIRLA